MASIPLGALAVGRLRVLAGGVKKLERMCG